MNAAVAVRMCGHCRSRGHLPPRDAPVIGGNQAEFGRCECPRHTTTEGTTTT